MIMIVDYGMSNLRSVAKAVEAAGGRSVKVSNKLLDLQAATHIILPGQGAFPDGMANLKKGKLIEGIRHQINTLKKPFLGICLGMQLLATSGHESGVNNGLNIISGKTIHLTVKEKKYKLPHIGWNDIAYNIKCPLFKGLSKSPDFYFDHSYYLEPLDSSITVATCTYGQTFPVTFWRQNLFATLFHPEKSQTNGIKLLKNFIQTQFQYHA